MIYEEYRQFTEDGYNADSPIQFTNFDNLLNTTGNGFSFSLGGIAKLNDNIRVGGSYQSPTWYRLQDSFSQRIDTNIAQDEINLGNSEIDFIDFGIINVFERYTIKTPSKLTGSAAIVFGKDGLLSFDYGYQDMSEAELRPNSDPNFNSENAFIQDALGTVSTYRIGGEYKIANVSLRGGYRFEQSPYEEF